MRDCIQDNTYGASGQEKNKRTRVSIAEGYKSMLSGYEPCQKILSDDTLYGEPHAQFAITGR